MDTIPFIVNSPQFPFLFLVWVSYCRFTSLASCSSRGIGKFLPISCKWSFKFLSGVSFKILFRLIRIMSYFLPYYKDS